MSSPLPGMDPYLEEEKRWPAFQPLLVQRCIKSFCLACSIAIVPVRRTAILQRAGVVHVDRA